MSRGAGRRLVVVVLAMLTVAAVSGCGDSSKKTDPALRSGVGTAFTVKTVKDERYVVGHGIEMRMPGSWVTYEPEKVGTDGSTWEWAAGLPADTRPLPAGVQYSMGKPGEGVQLDTLPTGARKLAETSPGYKFLDDGKVDVPGAKGARFLRFERDLELAGGTVHVEQVSLFVEVDKGVTSTLRFIAAQGDWDKQMKSAYDSVKVSSQDSA
jgi:hypothetical protein